MAADSQNTGEDDVKGPLSKGSPRTKDCELQDVGHPRI